MEPTQQPKDSNYGKGAALLGLGALGLAAAHALRKIAGKAYLDHAENSAKVTAKEMFSLLDESGLRNNLNIKKSPGVSSSYSPEESVLRFPMKGNRPQVPVGTVAHELGHASIDKGLLNPFSKAIQDVRPSIMKMAGRLGDLTGGNRERGRGIMGAITGSAELLLVR